MRERQARTGREFVIRVSVKKAMPERMLRHERLLPGGKVLDVAGGLAVEPACVECVIPDGAVAAAWLECVGLVRDGQSLCGFTRARTGPECSGSTCGGIDAGSPDATYAAVVSDASDGGLSTTSS